MPIIGKKNIEDVFGAPVFDMYGSQEGCHLFLANNVGQMVLHPLIGILQVLGSDGEIIVTGLNRKEFPLIRYQMGDSVIGAEFLSDVSRSVWRIQGVQGRSEDLVIKRDGSRIGYLCFHLTKDLEGVEEAQLVQSDYDKFKLKPVPNKKFDKISAEQHMLQNFKRRYADKF